MSSKTSAAPGTLLERVRAEIEGIIFSPASWVRSTNSRNARLSSALSKMGKPDMSDQPRRKTRAVAPRSRSDSRVFSVSAGVRFNCSAAKRLPFADQSTRTCLTGLRGATVGRTGVGCKPKSRCTVSGMSSGPVTSSTRRRIAPATGRNCTCATAPSRCGPMIESVNQTMPRSGFPTQKNGVMSPDQPMSGTRPPPHWACGAPAISSQEYVTVSAPKTWCA